MRWNIEKWQVLLLGFVLLHQIFNIFVMPAMNDVPEYLFREIYFLINVVFIALPVFLLSQKQIAFQPVKHSVITPFFFIFGCLLIKASSSQYFYQLFLPQPLGSVSLQPGSVPASAYDDIYTVFSSLVMAPLVEETIYRLGLLGTVALILGRFPALLISSAVFAIGHLGRLEAVTLVPYFAYGLLLGLTYLLYGPVWSIFAHFTFNFQGFLNSKGYIAKALAGPLATTIFGIFAISGLYIFFQQLFKNRKDFGRFSARN